MYLCLLCFCSAFMTSALDWHHYLPHKHIHLSSFTMVIVSISARQGTFKFRLLDAVRSLTIISSHRYVHLLVCDYSLLLIRIKFILLISPIHIPIVVIIFYWVCMLVYSDYWCYFCWAFYLFISWYDNHALLIFPASFPYPERFVLFTSSSP